MAFVIRNLFPDQYYHLIIQGNNHTFVFKDESDFEKFHSLFTAYLSNYQIECFHYVYMNSHIHAVIRIHKNIGLFPEVIKAILLKYYYYYKRKYNHSGSLWRKRYKTIHINSDRHITACGLYIEHNPVRAGIVQKPDDYRWSSFQHWSGTTKDPLLSNHPLVINDYHNMAKEYLIEYGDFMSSVRKPKGRPKKQQ